MFCENVVIPESDLPDSFAEFFKNKVQIIVNEQTTLDTVYNCVQKINAENLNFMTGKDIRK